MSQTEIYALLHYIEEYFFLLRPNIIMNIIMTFLQPPGPLGIKLSHCSKVKCSASSRGKSSSLIFIIIMFLAWRHFHHYITTVVIFRTITYKSFPSKCVRSCSFFSRFCELLLLFVIICGTNT